MDLASISFGLGFLTHSCCLLRLTDKPLDLRAFRVSGFGFRVSDLKFGFRISTLGLEVSGLGCRVRCRAQGLEVSGLGAGLRV